MSISCLFFSIFIWFLVFDFGFGFYIVFDYIGGGGFFGFGVLGIGG